jgi:hypothetical protein
MDKFMTTITPMYRDRHIHGCNRAAMLRLTQDRTVCFETKGKCHSMSPQLTESRLTARNAMSVAWLMGGRKSYIIKIAELYEEMLTNALPLGTKKSAPARVLTITGS